MMQLKLPVGSSASFSCRGFSTSIFVFLVAFFGLAGESRGQGPWEAIEIGTMFEGWDTLAHAVNDRGQVAGHAQSPLSEFPLRRRAFLWTPATGFVDLGHLGGEESMALGVNNAGQVVGWSRTQNFAYRAFLWSPATGMVDIDGTGFNSNAQDINEAGVVTGYREISGSYRAFRWTAGGGMVDLRGPVSFGSAINDAGMIAGSGGPVNTGQALPRHPFVWTPDGGVQNLGWLNGSSNAQVDVAGISNAGQVVGYNAENPLSTSAYSWTAASGLVGINTLSPSGVNDKGLIVGGGGATRVGGPLLELGNPEGLQDSRPRDVNRSGVVVGYANRRMSNPDRYVTHAVVWRPRLDVAVNFGANAGVWLLGKTGWSPSPIHGLGPESVTAADVDGNGLDDLVMDFGATSGVWLWLNHTTWMHLHASSPTEVAVGDLDWNGKDELVLNFPGWGLWIWRNHSHWEWLHALNPQRLAVGNLDGVNGDDLIADFPGAGLWVFMNNGTWVPLNIQSATRLVTGDLDGNGKDEVVIDFPAVGLWIYWNNATWQPLHQLHPTQMAIGDPKGAAKASLVIDFGTGTGIWQWHHPTGWTSLHGAASAGILLVDRDANGKDEILINFGDSGLWQYSDTGAWSIVHGARPVGMAAGVLH